MRMPNSSEICGNEKRSQIEREREKESEIESERAKATEDINVYNASSYSNSILLISKILRTSNQKQN